MAPFLDVHQHLWSEPLVSALSRRTRAPKVVSSRCGERLELAGEAPSAVAVDDPSERAALTAGDGAQGALVSLSSGLGVEALPPAEADELLEAYADGARLLPDRFASWAPTSLSDPDPRRVERLLDEGFVGLSLPATAIATRAGLEHAGPLLEALDRRGAPLFVHPGPAAGPATPEPWWPAVTDYVAGLQRAWIAWIAFGGAAHPRLRVVFAALAGLAPLHRERLAARGAELCGSHPNVFYDTSSYGPRALGWMSETVGRSQLVYGSDRPFAAPTVVPDAELAVSNPRRLLDG